MKNKLTYHGRPVMVKAESYRNNNTLALTLNYEDGDRDVVSVNLNSRFQCRSMTFLDTNNYPGIDDWVQKNGIGQPVGISERSGFCKYNLYTIFLNVL